MARITFSVVLASAILASTTNAQYTPPDSAALEGVIVERYYVADQSDATDEDGSAQLVPGVMATPTHGPLASTLGRQLLGAGTRREPVQHRRQGSGRPARRRRHPHRAAGIPADLGAAVGTQQDGHRGVEPVGGRGHTAA